VSAKALLRIQHPAHSRAAIEISDWRVFGMNATSIVVHHFISNWVCHDQLVDHEISALSGFLRDIVELLIQPIVAGHSACTCDLILHLRVTLHEFSIRALLRGLWMLYAGRKVVVNDHVGDVVAHDAPSIQRARELFFA